MQNSPRTVFETQNQVSLKSSKILYEYKGNCSVQIKYDGILTWSYFQGLEQAKQY